MKTSLEEVLKFRQEMYDKSHGLVAKKGSDYNRQQQHDGDTLFNLRVAELTGIVDCTERGILVRLSDKFMRLQSLLLSDEPPANTDESILDTVADIHNYVDYAAFIHYKRKAGRAFQNDQKAAQERK